jgi:hypothetical protein
MRGHVWINQAASLILPNQQTSPLKIRIHLIRLAFSLRIVPFTWQIIKK